MLHEVDDISGVSLKFAVQDDTLDAKAPNLLDGKIAKDISQEVKQPPPGDAGIPMINMASWDAQNCKHQHMDDLRTTQHSAKAHEDTTQSDTASFHCWLMPTCSRSAQSNAHSTLSPVETSNSAGRLPSDELSIAGVKGNVDINAGANPRDEYVLLSYSELCRLKENGEWLHAAGYNTASYADITKRGIEVDGAVEPGKGATLISLHPITAEDRLAALGRSSCHDEVVGSTEVGSSHDGVPADQPGGEPKPCTSIGIQRKNIAEMQKQFDNPRVRLDIPPPFPIDGVFIF
ncbi:hypothetical protein Nepgr_021863 [Nepenthes gracilis]|uniref:Uncharacterized protein n=1 Tax=Nepenthes gracilis TaxID=150966 RepID=A0AAD3XWA3_NEPGR|nr:hypothetical protein Nepgr_021863 [Nepenthes gracilis]